MSMGTNVHTRRRIAALFFVFCACLLLLMLRLAWLQLVRGHEFEAQALEERLRDVVVPARRGKIFDRQMRELAISVSAPSVVAFPQEVKLSGREKEISDRLATILGVAEEEIYQKITKSVLYCYVRRKVEFAQADQIARLKLPGIEVIEENQRYYPNGPLAANVLGFAGIDNQGLEGIEHWYDSELRGRNGALRVEADAVGREIPQATHSYEPPVDGHGLVLTIDNTIQYLVERELENLMQSPTAPAKCAITIMDPRTGEILAMASRPSFDPNRYAAYPQSSWRNPIICDSYEPGSTFKIITAAAAIEEGVVQEEEKFYDPGYIKVGPQRIKCWRFPRGHGSQSFVEGVKNSCNPVFVSLGLRLFEKDSGCFNSYIRAFGFGSKTGVDTCGEATGQVIPTEKLRDIYVGSIAIGQSVAVTPIQLVAAVGAVANGGLLVRPHLVREIRDVKGGLVRRINVEPVRQVISPNTASRLGLILEQVVKDGTGKNAYIPGYRVAGKTGTAQKPGPGGYSGGKYVASFVGYAPVNDPRLVCLVIVDEPKGYPYFGGTVAAPIFQRVVEGALRYLGVPPAEEVAGPQEVEQVAVPQVLALPIREATAVLRGAGFDVQSVGGGVQVWEQTPKAGASVNKGSKILLNTKPGSGILVPDLTGLSHSQAFDRLNAVGLVLEAQGSGEVLEQDPVPFTRVPAGQKVKVTLQEVAASPTLAP